VGETFIHDTEDLFKISVLRSSETRYPYFKSDAESMEFSLQPGQVRRFTKLDAKYLAADLQKRFLHEHIINMQFCGIS